MKFDFSKSTDADLSNKITINKLDLINKNLLYVTHQVDFIRQKIVAMEVDKHLQTQVDEYFEKDPFGSAFKESLNETPPQTDSDEQ